MSRLHAQLFGIGLACALAGWVAPHAAIAAIAISTGATTNMACSSGVCAPTSIKAVLNVNDLETLLAAGNVLVTTTGSGVQARDIQVDAPLTWTNGNSLSLDAYQSITVDKTVSVAGSGGLSLATDDGGSNGVLSFGPKGNVQFANLASALAINGTAFSLVNSIASLARAVATNPSGAYALASNYDASSDGTYHDSPISSDLTGIFEGLGNAISNISIKYKSRHGGVGFFSDIASTGAVDDIRLSHETIHVYKTGSGAAGLVFVNSGQISGDSVSGTFIGENCYCDLDGLVGGNNGYVSGSFSDIRIRSLGSIGGLVGGNYGEIRVSHSNGKVQGAEAGNLMSGGLVAYNGGTIDMSYAAVSVTGGSGSYMGGLVGEDQGYVISSYAMGNVAGGSGSIIGGLDGYDEGTTQNAYATGAVTGGTNAYVGGLIGSADATVQTSYSIGAANGANGSVVGGLIGGYDDLSQLSDCYWDTTTSGTDQGTGDGNEAGLTGLTTQQLQAGLPNGFDPKIWTENAAINNGFPYLIGNPPPKK